jgi:hypothetical protein
MGNILYMSILYTASLIPCVLPNVSGLASTPPPTAAARPASSPEQVPSANFFQTKSSGAQQCWGIRIRMFLGLLDPDPLVSGMNPDPDPSLFS